MQGERVVSRAQRDRVDVAEALTFITYAPDVDNAWLTLSL